MHSSLHCILIVLCFTLCTSASIYENYIVEPLHHSTNQEKVKLSVFYEALCPDSIDFFVGQLTSTYQSFSNYVNLDLVPYGNAKQTFSKGHWNFTCQHGPLECSYNKIHACAISLSKNQTNANKFVLCLMADKEESAHLHKCASKYNIHLDPIQKCSKSSQGDNLLAKLGNKTHSFKPPIKWVPLVAFNNVYTKKDQAQSMKNLPKVICKHLKHKPKVCHNYL